MKHILIVGSGQAGLIAATTIKSAFAAFEVTVVSSKEIEPIGVGEGSTEQWAAYEDRVGINRRDLIKDSMATFKYGIRFLDWTNHTPDYFHSISGRILYTKSGTFNGLYNYIHSSGRQLTPTLTHAGLIDNLVPDTPNPWHQTNQFHFDSAKLNTFLIGHARTMGVKFVDAVVDGIERDPSSGDITSVVTSTGNIETDFVIDASGFNQVILKKLGDVWQSSFDDYLPCDSVLVFQTPGNDEIKPFTEAKALSSGWHWDIPTYERRGHGYVFSSRYIDEEQAVEEVEQYVGEPVTDARIIKYKPFKVENSWQFNCVAVGLASNFIEPLEATSIAATIEQSRLICSYLPTYRPNSTAPQQGYTKVFDSMFDNFLTMVALHYVSDRDDSPMWIDQQHSPKPELLNFLIEIFSHRGPEAHDLPMTGYELFQIPHFWHVAQGQGLIDKEGARVGVEAYGSTQPARNVLKDLAHPNENPLELHHRVILDRAHKIYADKRADWHFDDFGGQLVPRLEL
jgi:hypothetical protein